MYCVFQQDGCYLCLQILNGSKGFHKMSVRILGINFPGVNANNNPLIFQFFDLPCADANFWNAIIPWNDKNFATLFTYFLQEKSQILRTFVQQILYVFHTTCTFSKYNIFHSPEEISINKIGYVQLLLKIPLYASKSIKVFNPLFFFFLMETLNQFSINPFDAYVKN